MGNDKVFEPIGLIVAAATFFLSLFIFYADNSMFFGSLFAAIMASGLAWATYVGIRLVVLAIKR